MELRHRAKLSRAQRGLKRLADYFESEYGRRIRRHAFYEDLGYGGIKVMQLSRMVSDEFGTSRPPGSHRTRNLEQVVASKK